MAPPSIPRVGTKRSFGVIAPTTETANIFRPGLMGDVLETLEPVSLDNLDDLKRRYASFIIQVDRLQPALYRADALATPHGTLSIREMLGHLIDTDRNIWWPRIEAALDEVHPVFSDIDPQELLREHGWRSQPMENILSQLVRARWDYGMKLNSLTSKDFERTGAHPALGDLSILHMLQIMVVHDEHYLEKIRIILAGATGSDGNE